MPIINWEITFGNLLTIVVLVITALGAFFRFQSSQEAQSGAIKRLEGRTKDVETDLKEIEKALVSIAVQSERMSNQDERMARLEREVDRLRTGEGFILPLPGNTGRGPK